MFEVHFAYGYTSLGSMPFIIANESNTIIWFILNATLVSIKYLLLMVSIFLLMLVTMTY